MDVKKQKNNSPGLRRFVKLAQRDCTYFEKDNSQIAYFTCSTLNEITSESFKLVLEFFEVN